MNDEGKKGEELPRPMVTLPIKWHVPDNIQSRYVHDVVVQPGKHEITVFFFEALLPPFIGSGEEYRAFLVEQGSVTEECVGKLILSPGLVPEVIKALQVGLDNYYAAKGQDEKANEKEGKDK